MSGAAGGTGGRNQSAFRPVTGPSASSIGVISVIETSNKRVTAIEAKPGYCLAITYADGCEIIADLSDVVRNGGAFRPLQDESLFSLVKPSASGDGIEGPEPKDKHGEPLISIDAVSIYRAYDQIGAANYRKRLA